MTRRRELRTRLICNRIFAPSENWRVKSSNSSEPGPSDWAGCLRKGLLESRFVRLRYHVRSKFWCWPCYPRRYAPSFKYVRVETQKLFCRVQCVFDAVPLKHSDVSYAADTSKLLRLSKLFTTCYQNVISSRLITKRQPETCIPEIYLHSHFSQCLPKKEERLKPHLSDPWMPIYFACKRFQLHIY